jgi:PTS system mannose-specific IID component
MVGAMTSQMVNLEIVWNMTMDGEVVMNIQEMLDQIFVGLIPLVITLLSFYLLKKKIVSINVLIFGMIILGIVLALLGIA